MEFLDPTSAINLPNELWIEIFKNVDSPDLLQLSMVCKHWNRLIFMFLARRFQLNLDLSVETYPKKGIRLVPDRVYKRLHLTLTQLDSSFKSMRIIQKLAPNLESLKLSLEYLDIQVLMQVLKSCTCLRELYIKGLQQVFDVFGLVDLLNMAVHLVSGETTLDTDHKLNIIAKSYEPCLLGAGVKGLKDAWPIFPAITTLGLDASVMDKFEKKFFLCFPNVTELEIVATSHDLGMIEGMANRLKVLKVKVFQEAVTNFFALRLPTLEVLVLKLSARVENDVLQQFLLGCKALKTAMFSFHASGDVFPALVEGLPLVERLQISGQTCTTLLGLEKLTHLKELALRGCCVRSTSFYFVLEPTYSVNKLECIGVTFDSGVSDLMYRCQFITSLTLSVRSVHIYGMSHYAECLQLVEEFTLLIDRVYPVIIKQMKEMFNLVKLVIKAKAFSKTNFKLLEKVIVQPRMKTLLVEVTELSVPMYIARKVASANRACMLILNGERVEPNDVPVRPVGRKRKTLPVVVNELTN
ncbi:uncharacterized protein LOC110680300 [Aedes aegypti]|uniref:F-box domain-containing protein n=1 Tax=Aedes aegypti TaxID=7159 RepID=A0A903VRZ6_AEDAE|nr:uncharacterized protein LOC110680300 [Aedes aegypti]